MQVGDDAVIDRGGFDALIDVLRRSGLRTMGPIVGDGAIVHGEIRSTADLPKGWHDHADPGSYRLTHDEGPEIFGWAVGPASWKSEFFAPTETVWRATVHNGQVELAEPEGEFDSVALIGARPCEIAALDILDRVLRKGAVQDDRYEKRRAGAFVVVVECGTPSNTCFCTSMATGPGAVSGYDLALTESTGPANDEHLFYVQVGSIAGAEVLAKVPHRALRRRSALRSPGNPQQGCGTDGPHP